MCRLVSIFLLLTSNFMLWTHQGLIKESGDGGARGVVAAHGLIPSLLLALCIPSPRVSTNPSWSCMNLYIIMYSSSEVSLKNDSSPVFLTVPYFISLANKSSMLFISEHTFKTAMIQTMVVENNIAIMNEWMNEWMKSYIVHVSSRRLFRALIIESNLARPVIIMIIQISTQSPGDIQLSCHWGASSYFSFQANSTYVPSTHTFWIFWGLIKVLLRPALGQSDEPSDLRGSLSPTTRHRCTHVLVYTAPGSHRRSPIQLWTGPGVA